MTKIRVIGSLIALVFAATVANAAPKAPTSLVAATSSASQVNLTWVDQSSNEDGFRIERALTTSGPWSTAGSVGPNIVSFPSTGLTSSTTYYFRVFATSSGGDSTPTNVAGATTLAAIPAAPSGLNASAFDESTIDLWWTDNSTTETGFKVESASSSSGPWTQITITSANSPHWSVYNLPGSTTYYFRVRAASSAGDSAYSSVASATTLTPPPQVPAAPTNVAASAVSSTQIRVSWTDAATNEAGYTIERIVGSTWAQVASLPANYTSWTDSSLTASTSYTYRISVYNDGGRRYGPNVSATTLAATGSAPTAPSALAASVISSSQINLTWLDNSSNETSFSLERALAAAGPFSVIASPGANVTAYSNIGLTASTTYYYRVRSYNTYGYSSYTTVVPSTTSSTVPPVPSGLSSTPASSSQVNLTWTGSGVSYKIEHAGTSTGPWSSIGTTGSTTFQDTNLSGCGTWFYHVSACNSAGGCSAFSSPSSATTLMSVPSAPTSVFASSASSTQINVSWSSNSTCPASSYKIERAASSAGPWTQVGTATTTTYQNSGLTASTAYYYHVRATNSAGDSAYSNYATATTLVASGVPGQIDWAKSYGGSSVDVSRAITLDSSDNVVMAGGFMGTTDLGTGPLTSAGGTDLFIAKYSASGSPIWSVRYGDTGEENVSGMALDRSGNILLVGSFSGATNLGGSSLTSAGNTDIFVAKYSATGTHIWSKRLGAASIDNGLSIATDTYGNVFISGTFAGTVDFGAKVLSASSGGDGFLAKYAPDGTSLWAKSFASTAADVPSKVATDANGDLLVAGYFSGTLDLGGTLLISAGAEDVFVAKVSGSDGAQVWSKRFGADRSDMARDLKVDGSGNVLVTGSFYNTIDFGGGALTSAGFQEAFVAELSGVDGRQLWSRSMGGGSDDKGDALAVDSSGNVIVTGTFSLTANFGGTAIVSTGGSDIVVAKYSPSGVPLWSRGEGGDIAPYVAVSSTGKIYMTGYYSSSIYFGTTTLVSAGSADVYLISQWP